MRIIILIACVLSVATLASCDLRSGIARDNMEKYTSTPTPTPSISPTPTPEPIDPADIVEVNTSLEGATIAINGYDQDKTVECTKFNPVMVNGDINVITIKGACRQVMINGDKNKITANAAMEIVINGTENTVTYSRFANGKRPAVVENKPGNTIEKATSTNKK